MLLGSKQSIHFRNLLMEQARIEHAPNGSLLTYINRADALVNILQPNDVSISFDTVKYIEWLLVIIYKYNKFLYL